VKKDALLLSDRKVVDPWPGLNKWNIGRAVHDYIEKAYTAG
jgi:hypothetical protein